MMKFTYRSTCYFFQPPSSNIPACSSLGSREIQHLTFTNSLEANSFVNTVVNLIQGGGRKVFSLCW